MAPNKKAMLIFGVGVFLMCTIFSLPIENQSDSNNLLISGLFLLKPVGFNSCGVLPRNGKWDFLTPTLLITNGAKNFALII